MNRADPSSMLPESDTSPPKGQRKLNRPLVFGVASLLAAASVVTVIALSASSEPTISNDFSTADEALTVISGGSWAIENQAFRLSTPAVSSNDMLSNLAVHPVVINSKEWRYNATATVTSLTGFAVVFGYIDSSNYWYVDIDSQHGGMFYIKQGVAIEAASFTPPIALNKVYAVEVRNEGDNIKVYLDGAYLGKAKNAVVPPSGKFGVGTRGGAATFDNLQVETEELSNTLPTAAAPTVTSTITPTPDVSVTVLPAPPAGIRRIDVSTSAQLAAALAAAKPGDNIEMADGSYTGKTAIGKYTGSFGVTVSGTASAPIVLHGSRGAVIDGDGLGGHYGLYVVGAQHWRFDGFTVTNATKGVVLDGSSNNVLSNLRVHTTGQEGVHFRANSSDNALTGSEITDTGKRTATYGEGVYVGSANSNWKNYTGGQPDRSDRNQIIGNVIARTGAESVDIKEGTTGGVIRGNRMDGAGMSGSWADSWIDVKGNSWTIAGNFGTNALLDGFQVHVAIAGWGLDNLFAGNTATVNGPGWGLSIQKGATGNVWKCDNTVVRAAKGAAAINNAALACTS